MSPATVVCVPGLRGHDEDHWQTRLAASVPGARTVPPLGRTNASLRARVIVLDRVVAQVPGPVVLVAHGAGALVAVHWAARYDTRGVVGALLATPPALATELPPGYPPIARLRACGWLPVPRRPLPFPSIVAVSSDDPLGNPVRVAALASAWGSQVHDLGAVGHLEPASGSGHGPEAAELVERLRAGTVERDADGAGLRRALDLVPA
ncbi:RBBP9/YdeN family alpha/beta hydrolase [Geodermatophilus sp. SYSU D00766]